jgi:hypothetical protein
MAMDEELKEYIVIFNGSYFFLSNFFPSEIKYDGITFELHNGIGYKKVKSLDIPNKAMQELKNYFKNMKK